MIVATVADVSAKDLTLGAALQAAETHIDPDLKTILSWVRPARSKSEAAFVHWLVARLEDYGQRPTFDDFGNIWCVNGSKTLFTSHTDTAVVAESNPAPQDIRLEHGVIRLEDPVRGRVLGADDGAGIALILHMIKSGVQADYVFFREEEVGGHGSRWAASNLKLDHYDRAIAFDRRGTSDVITHQAGMRCCSQDFAIALAFALGGTYRPDDTGVFTDTANLTEVIPECTNISTGYYSEHTCSETLDYRHWKFLCNQVTKVAWHELPVVRRPTDFEYLGDGLFYSEDELDSWAHYIALDGLQAAQDLVYSDPEMAAELLVRLVK